MSFDIDAIKRRIDALNGKKQSFSNVKLWKPSEGEHTIRILPWKPEQTQEGMPFIERNVYFGIARKPIVSPRSFGKPDPIDDFIRKLYDEARDGKPESKALANKLRPKLQTCAAIIDRNNPSEGPQLWAMNVLVVKDVFALFMNKECSNFMDLENGRDLTVTISPSGKKFNDKPVMDVKVMPKFSTSKACDDQEQLKKWLDNLPNVDEFYRPQSYEEIKKLFEEWLDSGGPSDIVKGAAPVVSPPATPPAENQIEAIASALKEKKKDKDPSKKDAKDITKRVADMLIGLDSNSDSQDEE